MAPALASRHAAAAVSKSDGCRFSSLKVRSNTDEGREHGEEHACLRTDADTRTGQGDTSESERCKHEDIRRHRQRRNEDTKTQTQTQMNSNRDSSAASVLVYWRNGRGRLRVWVGEGV